MFGIVVIDKPSDLKRVAKHLQQRSIHGHLPSEILLENFVDADRELYLSLLIDRDTRIVEYMVSAKGGINIEDHAHDIVTVDINAEDKLKTLSDTLKINDKTLAPLLKKLEKCFFENDLLLCEINPLVLTKAGRLVCADAKLVIDDNARYRQKDLPWPGGSDNNMRILEGGTIGCIANGAGMAMSTMDSIVAAGGTPANFLDIGGGTGEAAFVKALKQITDLSVSSIVINIFAGISRCDEVARGIIAAKQQINDLPPLFIRLEGTNRNEGLMMLKKAGITTEPDLSSCIRKAMEASI